MANTDEKLKVLAVVGPTASGKTSLAVELALRLGGEVVSADSMQIYEGMDIGTAKPAPEEMRGVSHHLIGFVPPEEEYSVADYVRDAGAVLLDIGARGKLPVIAGGTGLYVDSLLQNVQFGEADGDPVLRAELKAFADEHGNEALHERLRAVDPELAEKLHPNNVGRVARAIEVFSVTGVTMSQRQRLSKLEPSPYDVFWVGLTYRDREKLYSRIDMRVDAMLQHGLLDEARRLRGGGLSYTASQAIGYKELFAFLDGEKSLDEAVEELKRSTRRYAKRQLTWFRRNVNINWVYMDEPEVYNRDVSGYLIELMRERRFYGV